MNVLPSLKMNKYLTALMVGGLALSSVLAGEPKVKKQDPTVFFWYHFRSAVMNGGLPKLHALTLFPFETINENGDSVKNSKSQFSKLFHPLLDTPGKDGKPMREIIRGKEDLTEEERGTLAGGELQVANFRFRMVKNKCFFVGANLAAATPLPEKSPPPDPVVVPTAVAVAESLSGARAKEPDPDVSDTAAPNSVFRFFWVEFRQAALGNDLSRIKSLTRFPFETKGPLEDDKKRKFLEKEFDVLWPRLLETDPHSWGPLRDSMKELIYRREEPSVEEIATEPTGHVHVGAFVFRKIKSRWFFTRAIVAE